jgi:hypothetical protein
MIKPFSMCNITVQNGHDRLRRRSNVGDLLTLLNTLNLGPVNSVLLATLYFVLRSIFSRVEAMERQVGCHAEDIAHIQGRLEIQEDR